MQGALFQVCLVRWQTQRSTSGHTLLAQLWKGGWCLMGVGNGSPGSAVPAVNLLLVPIPLLLHFTHS